jgi:hypothetical protein
VAQQQQQEEQETDEAFYRKSLLCNRDKIFKQKLYYTIVCIRIDYYYYLIANNIIVNIYIAK